MVLEGQSRSLEEELWLRGAIDVLDGLSESAGTKHHSILEDRNSLLLVVFGWDLASSETYLVNK